MHARTRLLALLLLSAPSGAALARPTAPPVDDDRESRLGSAVVDQSARYQPGMTVIDQRGRRLRFYEDLIRGRVVLINFMFTTCTSICPPMTANLAKVQRLLGARLSREVIMLSITVDPEVDTPEVLRRYAERHGALPGWFFLTAPRDDLSALLAKLGNTNLEKARHSGLLLLGNDATRTWTRMQAQAPPEEIASAVRQLLQTRAR